ncbi:MULTISPECIES: hypothetical protein [Acinetobacter Taxon 24D]|uniref:hypothetical protein n=1 Tax=Acinetobacter Taxon 24D TaxID=2839057 RepID=UPI00103F21D8|nr:MULTISPECIES: hypothetical protein [Acinetobacter Taxon 24D]NNH01532.1 hypothetical protein [Acinetobacter sp. ANC 5414]TCH65340.1 hypothetical protein E0409_01035 [Acinetobacter sp. ANC 4862]
MRKLQFTANCEKHNHVSQQPNDCHVTQEYVADLLSKELGQYGFQTLSQSGDQVAVSVDNQSLPLSVTCQGHDAEGHLVCEITSYPDEEQDWLDRITEQSLLNQLAQAVENTLKEDESFSEFKWTTS